MDRKVALIAGATGLVGTELVNLMLQKNYYDKIKILSRSKLPVTDDRLEYVLMDTFDVMNKHRDLLEATDYYCTLGTTMKRAGTKRNFEKIDLEYPLQLAKLAQSFSDFQQYLVVTAAGSKSSSPIFYNRVKGKLEDELKKLNLRGLKIFRPSILLGHRQEYRPGEVIGRLISRFLTFFMVGAKKGLFAIHSADVARAMYMIATQNKPGVEVFSSRRMVKLVKSAGL